MDSGKYLPTGLSPSDPRRKWESRPSLTATGALRRSNSLSARAVTGWSTTSISFRCKPFWTKTVGLQSQLRNDQNNGSRPTEGVPPRQVRRRVWAQREDVKVFELHKRGQGHPSQRSPESSLPDEPAGCRVPRGHSNWQQCLHGGDVRSSGVNWGGRPRPGQRHKETSGWDLESSADRSRVVLHVARPQEMQGVCHKIQIH